jgi:hypothetical protein
LTLIDVEGNKTVLGTLPHPLMRHASRRMASASHSKHVTRTPRTAPGFGPRIFRTLPGANLFL